MSTVRTTGAHLSDRIEYRLYYGLLYPFVFTASLVSRVFRRRYVDDRKTGGNVFNETTAALNAALPWMFMGR